MSKMPLSQPTPKARLRTYRLAALALAVALLMAPWSLAAPGVGEAPSWSSHWMDALTDLWQSWSAISATSDAGPDMDPNGAQGDSGPSMDPNGESATAGPDMDPNGVEADAGPDMDPNG